MNLTHRSYQKELLDEDHIPFPDILRNMQELDFINTWLGGHGITISGFKELLGDKRKIHVCEIGCGGGDNLVAITRWCRKRDIEVHCTGIDIKKECIEVASRQPALSGRITLITSDYAEAVFRTQPDIIFSSLFCHHFTEEELDGQVKWMKDNAKTGFFINDLQRNKLAYYLIKWLTTLFSSSYLVKNDAPLSVARGFHKKEWLKIFKDAGFHKISIRWKWAFRYLIVYRHG